MAKPIVIYGAGGHGKVVADIANHAGYTPGAFIDDDPARAGSTHAGLPVFALSALIPSRYRLEDVVVALGIGDNHAREASARRVRNVGLQVVTLVHPRAVVAPSAILSNGVTVMAGSIVNPDAWIGEGAVLNTGCIVEHDSKIGEFALVGPGAALGGAVTIGPRTLIGVGASVLPGITIGCDARVGGGAVVHRNVRDGTTVVGVPARPRRY